MVTDAAGNRYVTVNGAFHSSSSMALNPARISTSIPARA